MAMTVAELAVVIGADVEPLRRAIASGETSLNKLAEATKRSSAAGTQHAVVQAKAAASLNQLAKSSTASAAGLNSVRGAMTSVAASALHTAPGVAPLVGILGSLAVGTPLMIGILAGGALIGKLWSDWTEKAKEARRATEEATEALAKLGGRTDAVQILDNVIIKRAELSKLEMDEARIRARQQRLDLSGATDVARAEANAQFAKLLADNAAAQAEVQALITKGQTEINRLHAAGATKLNAERVQQATEGAKLVEDARLKAARETLEKLAKLEQEFASKRSTFRGDLGTRLAGDGTYGPQANLGNLALGGATTSGTMSAANASRATQALDLLGSAALQAASAVSPFNLAMRVVNAALEPLAPVINTLLLPLTMLGQLIGTLLLPVLRPVAIAFSYVTQGIGTLIEALGSFVDNLVPDRISKVGKNLEAFGKQLQDDAKKARDGLNGVATAANNAANSITNMPAIFDYALRRRQAALGGMPGGGGATGGGRGGGSTDRPGGIDIHFHNPPPGFNGEGARREIKNALRFDPELQLLIKRAAA